MIGAAVVVVIIIIVKAKAASARGGMNAVQSIPRTPTVNRIENNSTGGLVNVKPIFDNV